MAQLLPSEHAHSVLAAIQCCSGKMSESQTPWSELTSPKALVRAWLGAGCSCVHSWRSMNIQDTQLRHLQLLFRISVGFQQQLGPSQTFLYEVFVKLQRCVCGQPCLYLSKVSISVSDFFDVFWCLQKSSFSIREVPSSEYCIFCSVRETKAKVVENSALCFSQLPLGGKQLSTQYLLGGHGCKWLALLWDSFH